MNLYEKKVIVHDFGNAEHVPAPSESFPLNEKEMGEFFDRAFRIRSSIADLKTRDKKYQAGIKEARAIGAKGLHQKLLNSDQTQWDNQVSYFTAFLDFIDGDPEIQRMRSFWIDKNRDKK